MIKRIFLDLDDVLNKCTMSALIRVGCDVGIDDLYLFDPRWKYNVVKAANELQNKWKFTTDEFWESLDENFWATIPKSCEFDYLIDKCCSIVGPANVCVLTTPRQEPWCVLGKIRWLENNLPKSLRGAYLIGGKKHICASHDSLLIDDSDKNVAKFQEHGGNAILVPRPWNSNNHLDFEFVKLMLDIVKKSKKRQ